MAVVDLVPQFRVPAIMPSARGVASESPNPVSEDKIYVTVGKDMKESTSRLVWTVRQSKGNFKICIIHVLVPSRKIPIGDLGVGILATVANEIVLREHRENERKNMHELLESYLLFCRQMGVQAEKEYIELDSIEKGIVELIRLHGIKRLVMGAALNKHYFKCQIGRRMTEITSRKAIFVRDKAPISCQIRFIYDGQLIHTREARTVQAVAGVPTNVPLPTTPSPGAGKSILLKSQSATLQRSASSYSDGCPVHPNAASILERQDTFQELERVSTSPSHSPQSVYHSLSSNSSSLDMNENDAREVLVEEVMTCAESEVDIIEGRPKDPSKRLYAEKLKEELEKVMEELPIARDQFVEIDQSRKQLELKIIASDEMLRTFIQERELLRIDLENALLKAEEVSRMKGDSSGTKHFSEFSFTEIAEAAQNFDPSLKIGEGGCGSVYRGLLRLTPVAIKIVKCPGMQSSKDFQQEVDVLREVRHPNLITLIGACPQRCTLVYEYIPNGSLEDWLRNSYRAKLLPWPARIRIATELCSALAFLHSWEPHSIVHGDVKPGNILLDAHFVSKLSDFGISRVLSGGEWSSNNTTVVHLTDPKGTFGYMDPEFLETRELTTKCDVYSFGIILLELLTRKPALGIANEVRKAISAGTLEAILDPSAGEWPCTLAMELTHLALRCCETSRRNRPDLRSDVWTVLQSMRASSR